MIILSGKSTEKNLLDLICDCTSFSIAVAWATKNDVFNAIKKHERKINKMIVGVDFYQTHPDVIQWMKGARKTNKMFIGKSKTGIFHPKVFYFKFDNRDTNALVIGSANLTAAAYGRNEEASVCTKIAKNDTSIDDLLSKWSKNGTEIKNFDNDAYKGEYLLKGRTVRQVLNKKGCDEFNENPDLLKMSFGDYYKLCKKDPFHYFGARLDLLEFCSASIEDQDDFSCVAGLKESISEPEILYGLFGSMKADAAFRDTVYDENIWRELYNLYQRIPSKAPISKLVARKFIHDVQMIINLNYGNEYGKLNHLSAATRLLAMKRPDLYFCVNGANAGRLAKDLGISVAGKNGIKTIDGYLDAAESLQKSTWGNSARPPTGNDSNILPCWEGRIAMIDSIYYEPI